MAQSAALLTWMSIHMGSLFAEALAYGIYCVLFFVCMIKIIRSRSWTGLQLLIFVAAILMFCVGTAHFILYLWQTFSTLESLDHDDLHTPLPWYEYTKALLEVANCLMGDLVIISIAFTLDSRSNRKRSLLSSPRLLYATPVLPLMASCVTGVGMVWTSGGVDVLSDAAMITRLRGFATAWMSCILATNLVSSIVFIYEYLSRKRLHGLGRLSVHGDRPFNALLFTLTFCGLLYCCTFTILLVLFLTNLEMCWIVNHMIPQLAGIYPISAIVVVAIRESSALQTLPRPNRARRFSTLLIGSPRDTKSSASLSVPPTPNNAEDIRAPVSTTLCIQPTYPPPFMPGIGKKLRSLRRLSRIKALGGPASLQPAVVLVQVQQTCMVDDSLSKNVSWSAVNMPHSQARRATCTSPDTKLPKTLFADPSFHPVGNGIMTDSEDCRDDRAQTPTQDTGIQPCPVAGAKCWEEWCHNGVRDATRIAEFLPVSVQHVEGFENDAEEQGDVKIDILGSKPSSP